MGELIDETYCDAIGQLAKVHFTPSCIALQSTCIVKVNNTPLHESTPPFF